MSCCKVLCRRPAWITHGFAVIAAVMFATASPAQKTYNAADDPSFAPLPPELAPAPPPQKPSKRAKPQAPPVTPSKSAPTEPGRDSRYAPLPSTMQAESKAATNAAQVPIQNVISLQGILVVPKSEDVNQAGVTGVRGVVIKGPAFLRNREFEALLRRYLGSPVTEQRLMEMQHEMRVYCQEHDHLIVDVFTSEQDMLEGTVQIAVIEGRVGKIQVNNPPPKWFSTPIILRDIRLKPGDVVIESRLNSDLNLANRNNYQSLGYDAFNGSFRQIDASFHQGQLGETDVDLNVQDRFPLRGFVGFEDSGIAVIGKDRLFAGFNWANAFFVDHRLTYQYITDTDFDKFREHVGTYVIPLPWRHDFTFFGAYADIDPDFSIVSPSLGTLKNKGTFYQLSARYSAPLPPFRKFDHEVTAGFDFKSTDTPLLFASGGAGGSLLRANRIEVAQFVLGYSGRLKHALGRAAFSLQGVYSPGGLTDRNEQKDFEEFAPGTGPNYLYGRMEVRQETPLPLGFSWYVRGSGQYSDSKLVASEVFGLGGYDTVRGYDERIVSGDHGFLLVNELRTTQLVLGNLTGQSGARDWVQGLIFCDYGASYNRNIQSNQRYNEILLSVGAGFRYQVADNLRFRFDYGFQLDREYLSSPSASTLGPQADRRAHVGAELSF